MQAKFRFIDALRGLAICAVILVHSALGVHRLSPWARGMFRSGEYGVQLFFVVSAFTLFLSLDRRKPGERHPNLNFFIRRFFRIAPLFWAAAVFYLWYRIPGMEGWLGSEKHITRGNIASAFTFTNGWNPRWLNSIVPGGWSVATEMGFYLLVPFLFLRLKSLRAAAVFTVLTLVASIALHYWLWTNYPYRLPRHRPPAAEAVIPGPVFEKQNATAGSLRASAAAASREAASASAAQESPAPRVSRRSDPAPASVPVPASQESDAAPTTMPETRSRDLTPDQKLWHHFLDYWLPNQLPVFGLGFVVFFVFQRIRDDQTTPIGLLPPAARPIAGYALLLVFVTLVFTIPLHEFQLVKPHFLFGVAFAVLTIALALHETPLLVNPFWTWLGKISFSAYLVHSPIEVALEARCDASEAMRHWYRGHPLSYVGLLFVGTLAGTMLVATVTYFLIEQPGQAIGRHLIRRLERRATSQEAREPQGLIR